MTIMLKMDDELHRRFKMLCAERRSNMTAELNWLATRELEQATKNRLKKAGKKK